MTARAIDPRAAIFWRLLSRFGVRQHASKEVKNPLIHALGDVKAHKIARVLQLAKGIARRQHHPFLQASARDGGGIGAGGQLAP